VSSQAVADVLDERGKNADGWVSSEDFHKLIVAKLAQRQEIMSQFSAFDNGDKGFLSISDLRRHADEDTDEATVQLMFSEADKDGDGMVTIEEFMQIAETFTAMDF
jgi:Ca2+-binding EF-hand superfamily protein